MIDVYFRKASGCFVVYDVTKRDTFSSLTYWLERVRAIEPACGLFIFIGI